MSDAAVAVVVLAAGQGSRMQSDLPKVLHRLGGVPLVGHALAAARSLDPEQIVVGTGHGADAVARAVAKLDPEATAVLQAEAELEDRASRSLSVKSTSSTCSLRS